MNTTRMTTIAIGLAVACVGVLSAQTQDTKTTTKTTVEMKGGKSVTVMGCLERRENGEYMLTSIRNVQGMDPSRYALVTNDDLATHVGERVRIEGKTVSPGDGPAPDTRTDVEHGKDLDMKSRTEGTTGTLDMPLLGVKSLKTLSSSCS